MTSGTELGRRGQPRAIEAGHRHRRIRASGPQGDELQGAIRRDRVRDLPVLVHTDRLRADRHDPGARGLHQLRPWRSEERIDLGHDDEQDGEDRRDDDEPAQHDRARGQTIEDDATRLPCP